MTAKQDQEVVGGILWAMILSLAAWFTILMVGLTVYEILG